MIRVLTVPTSSPGVTEDPVKHYTGFFLSRSFLPILYVHPNLFIIVSNKREGRHIPPHPTL